MYSVELDNSSSIKETVIQIKIFDQTHFCSNLYHKTNLILRTWVETNNYVHQLADNNKPQTLDQTLTSTENKIKGLVTSTILEDDNNFGNFYSENGYDNSPLYFANDQYASIDYTQD